MYIAGILEDLRRLREEWLACGERGGVLVSAAISTKEKEVLREAMNRGCPYCALEGERVPRVYKPCGESFYACSEGLLLQISPWDYPYGEEDYYQGAMPGTE